MLIRNWIELVIVLVLLTVGIIVYIRAKKKVNDLESELTIRKKEDIHEKIEDAEDVDATHQ